MHCAWYFNPSKIDIKLRIDPMKILSKTWTAESGACNLTAVYVHCTQLKRTIRHMQARKPVKSSWIDSPSNRISPPDNGYSWVQTDYVELSTVRKIDLNYTNSNVWFHPLEIKSAIRLQALSIDLWIHTLTIGDNHSQYWWSNVNRKLTKFLDHSCGTRNIF